ncbi:MAG: tetratricopeptide repeat protein [Parabacteroides sp.]
MLFFLFQEEFCLIRTIAGRKIDGNTSRQCAAILNKIPSPETLSNREYASYCLLFTQALDKNYITITSDSLIKKAVTYYENHNDIASLALSYYYMGRTYFDMQDALQAQQAYLKALELGESLNSTDLLIKINNSLGTLYSYQDIYETALPLYKKNTVSFGRE